MDPFLKIKIYKIVILLILFGAFNLAMIGIFDINLIKEFSSLFGNIHDYVERGIYILIGMFALLFLLNSHIYSPFLGNAEFPEPLHDYSPVITGDKIEHTINNLKPNTKILYWGAISSDKIFENPIDAYGDSSNQGVATTDNNGNVTIILNKPGIYKYPGKGKLKRHFHYRYWEANSMSSSLNTIYL